MAIGLIQNGPTGVPGDALRKVFTVTGDTSYPNPAGYVVTAASFGMSVLRRIVLNAFTTIAGAANELAIIPTYATDGSGSITSAAIHIIVGSTGAEVANATNVSGIAFQLIVEGN